MYGTIYVAVDNSDHSNAAVHLSIALGKRWGSRMVGSHVYAAKLHDVRFKQMEFTLPDEYKEETELEKQRRIHDALIARGLQLISDSYLDVMEAEAKAAGLEFEPKIFDGRTFEALVEDINDSDYDLVVMGALGQGAVRHSKAGSVVERVLRRIDVDLLVVRDAETSDLSGDAPILVAFDGSAHAWTALRRATAMAAATERKLEIAAVLEDGPEDDLLLAALMEARRFARTTVKAVQTTTLDGPARGALLAHAELVSPWLLVVGRQGLDAEDGDPEVGGTTEDLLRKSAGNTLIVGRPAPVETDTRSEVTSAEAVA